MDTQTIAVDQVKEKLTDVPITFKRYFSIYDVPEFWDSVAPTGKIGLERPHMEAVEESNINDIKPFYLVAQRGELPVGIAHCFIIQMDLSALGEEIPRSARASIKEWYPDFMDFKILEAGFPSNTGLNLAAAEEKDLPDLIEAAGREYNRIAREEKADIIFVRDIPRKLYPHYESFKKHGYKPSLGFPNVRMEIRWNSFDEYLAELKSAKRYNIRKKAKRLEQPEITVERLYSFAEHAERLAELWMNVSVRKTEYQHEILTADYFRNIDKYLGDRSHIIAIKRNEEIVSFALVLEGDTDYCWLYVGVDYTHRDQYDLYFNLIFQGIKGAIETGKKVMDLGLTTYDCKMYVGGEVEPFYYFLKHPFEDIFTGAFVSMFMKGIKQPDNIYQAFKGLDTSKRPTVPQLKKEIKEEFTDVFQQAYDYTKFDELKVIDVDPAFPVFESEQGPIVRYKGKEVIMLGSNSYLGLSTDKRVKAAAIEAIQEFGPGCTGSPYLNGTMTLHVKFQNKLANFVQKDGAVIYSTGYQTNVGVLSLLCKNRDVVAICDERNHASLIDGLRMSRCKKGVFRHNDMQHLEERLVEFQGQPMLVVVDSFFSMEGTIIDLPEVVRLAKKYDARIMVDESHAIGVFGPNGRGVAEHYGLLDQIDLVMSTFSKSMAAQGGFIASEERVINWLRHESRGHIFSVNLAPPIVAAANASLDIIINEPEKREQLKANAKYLYDGLLDLGYQASYSGGAIVPVFVGNEVLAAVAFNRLFELGCYVNPVLFPGVPKHEELLRISLMPTHTKEMLDRALDIFKKIRTPNFPAN